MSTTTVRPVEAPVSSVSKIRRTSRSELHTLVVRQGSQSVALRFTEAVTVHDVRSYCTGQLNWQQIEQLKVTVDGTTYSAEEAGCLLLKPSTDKVEFGQEVQIPTTVEFRQILPGKG